MGLEHWDERRGRWILYRTQLEHSLDCERYPFDHIPRRVFLDTNVVNLLVQQSEQIFEQCSIPSYLEATRANDTEALMHVFHVGARANWDILASARVLEEISNTRDADQRAELLNYAVELVELTGDGVAHAASLGRRLVDAPFLAVLPDLADRELIGNAVGFGCDVFCTRDRRTIISKRDRVHQLPLRILTPPEWWAHVKPWARLWS